MQKFGAPVLGLGVWLLDLCLQLYSSAYPDKLKPHPHLIEALGVVGLALILYGAIAWWREREKPDAPQPSKKQKAREVGGNMLQADTIHYSEGLHPTIQ
jgi:threonine/homoserine/homoserine lactone efflux protein